MVKYGEIVFKSCLSYIASKKKSLEKLLENDNDLTFKYSYIILKLFREFASRRLNFFKPL